MLTPKFSLTQNDDEIIVRIQAPFVRVNDTEIHIYENCFIFYSSPYYLRLHLPGDLVDSEKDIHDATYDGEKCSFTVRCCKATPGQHFVGLDMLTSLLTPKGDDKIKKPLIEVVGKDDEGNEESSDEEEFDWFFKQEINEEENLDGYKYGFANLHCGVFTSLRSELSGVVDVLDPDHKPILQRRKERLKEESTDFEDDHYLADLFDKEEIVPCLQFIPSFYKIKKEEVEYNEKEEEALLKLPRKELLVGNECKLSVYLGLVDILFSWCYNHRITQGENCPESAWNIVKVSSTLSWLDCFHSLKDCATSGMRRSLVYPLMRNWELSCCVLQDTIQLLLLGRKQVLKCLLEVQSLLNSYEPYYLLNQLYITDYCVWIQTVNDTKIISLGSSLKKVSVCKTEVDLELLELEVAAQLVLQEEREESANAIKSSSEKGVKVESQNEEEEVSNLNSITKSFDQLSVIENGFALSRNDNDAELDSKREVVEVRNNSCESDESESSDDDTSGCDNSSSSDDDSESSDSDSDSDDTDSSSGTSSLDSDDEIFVQRNDQDNKAQI